MKCLLRFLNSRKKSSTKRKLKIFNNTRLQQKRWLFILEQKVRQIRNGKSLQPKVLKDNSINEIPQGERGVIHINKSIIQREFLENKN